MSALIASFFIWAVAHSVTAAQFFKDYVRRLVGDERYHQGYRLFYTGFSVLSILPVFYFYWRLPPVTLWQVPSPWSWLLIVLQGVGLVGAAVSVMQTDAWSFVGIRQLFSQQAVQKRGGLGESLYIAGLYRWMRHPLYTFSLLFLWCTPTMTRNTLIFNLLATAYFVIGSLFEERRLTADFGQAYTAYQQAVPRFLPYRKPQDK